MPTRLVIQGYTSGDLAYSLIQRDLDGQVYKPAGGGAWEAFTSGNYANYVALMGTADELGRYMADVPNTLADGEYNLLAFQYVGAAAYGDAKVETRPFKMKGGNLVSDVDMLLAVDTVEASLTTIQGYVDTVETVLASVSSTLSLITGYVDTLETNLSTVVTALNTLAANVPTAAFIAGSVADGAPGVTGFVGAVGLSGVDNFYRNRWLVFTSGTLKGLSQPISSYVGNTRTFAFTSDNAWPVAPTNGDTFIITGKA